MKILTKFLATASVLSVLASSPAYADGNGSGAYSGGPGVSSSPVEKNNSNNWLYSIEGVLSFFGAATLGGMVGYGLAKREKLI